MRGCKIKNFKTLSLLDLASARVRTSEYSADVSVGDLVEIIAPFERDKNMIGIVVEVDDNYMTLYHGKLKKNIIWSRRVKCNISKL